MEVLTLNKRIEVSRLGATFPEDMEGAEWKAFWPELRTIFNSVNFVVGDWVNFGRRKYGEKYAAALDITEWEYGRLRSVAYVAGHVPLASRCETLDWSHHVVVAPLPEVEQQRYLAEARENAWTVSQLRISIRHAQSSRRRSSARVLGFVPSAWVAEGLRGFRQQDFSTWSPARRQALCAELRPIVDIYHALKD